MRLCTSDDFSFYDKAKEFFETWNGYHLICSDMPTEKSLFMRNRIFDSDNDVWSFNIDKCSGVKCKTKDEINDFIMDV